MTICVPSSSLENTDAERIEWIYLIFGECVYSSQEVYSVLLGYLSIVFWLNAQLPQVIENYKLGSTTSLSIEFLTIWFAGDLTNLLGCILTHQLPFQRYLGTYFVFIDICLLCQWLYYSYDTSEKPINNRNSSRTFRDRRHRHPNRHSQDLRVTDPLLPRPKKKKAKEIALAAVMVVGTSLFSPQQLFTSATTTKVDYLPTPTTLTAGRVFAWTCASLYLTSRIPQILKNCCRNSTDGLSPWLFVCAAAGNLAYASSILSNPELSSPGTLTEAMPYLVGSIGTLFFDFTIFCQFIWYRHRNSNICAGAHTRTKQIGGQNFEQA